MLSVNGYILITFHSVCREMAKIFPSGSWRREVWEPLFYKANNFMYFVLLTVIISSLISRAHSFSRQNMTNSAANLVNSADHRGKADEIQRLTADTQLNFRGLIKS